MKDDPGVSQGQRSPDYPDFGALRQPVYLPALQRRAEQGNDVALEGISHMETLDATAALIKLASEPDNPLALKPAQTLNNRLPDPQFAGKLPGRGPFDTSRVEDRRQLSQRCWDDRFTPEVRVLAKRLLAASDPGKGRHQPAHDPYHVGVADARGRRSDRHRGFHDRGGGQARGCAGGARGHAAGTRTDHDAAHGAQRQPAQRSRAAA